MWKKGYESGDLIGHIYPDFKPMLDWMNSYSSARGSGDNDNGGVSVYIYSSGSIAAQKLLFGHSSAGNLLPLLTGHYDIRTAGNKKEAASYCKIIQDITLKRTTLTANDIVFVSDSEAELKAAKEAGIGHAILSIRPGNAAITDEGRRTFPTIHSLLQFCGSMD
jgi:2,3-diketo-5-methylthio-1-phosphopentane phosphatase